MQCTFKTVSKICILHETFMLIKAGALNVFFFQNEYSQNFLELGYLKIELELQMILSRPPLMRSGVF